MHRNHINLILLVSHIFQSLVFMHSDMVLKLNSVSKQNKSSKLSLITTDVLFWTNKNTLFKLDYLEFENRIWGTVPFQLKRKHLGGSAYIQDAKTPMKGDSATLHAGIRKLHFQGRHSLKQFSNEPLKWQTMAEPEVKKGVPLIHMQTN